MKKLNLVKLLAAGALLALPALVQAGILGSPHDFSAESWNITPSDPNSVCGPCHQPHHANSSVIPLWGHATSQGPWIMYNTNNVTTIELFSTGGLLASATNQSSATFAIAGPWMLTVMTDYMRRVLTDLPGMVARKQALLAPLASLDARHRLVVCNILERDAPESLEAVIAREFNTAQPLAVITEGLVNYFDLDTISGVWQRLAHALRCFPGGTYLTDIYPEVSDHRFAGAIRAANRALRIASRSQFCLHFPDDVRMREHFQGVGFPQVAVFDPDHEATDAPSARGGALVRVVRASTR